jgi:hypothetical protein
MLGLCAQAAGDQHACQRRAVFLECRGGAPAGATAAWSALSAAGAIQCRAANVATHRNAVPNQSG